MKKIIVIAVVLFGLILTGCTPAVEVSCGEGTVAVDGVCVPNTTVTCEAGFTNVDGECVEDEVVCEAGFHEENGECVEDELVCETGFHEENGQCVEDELVCETGFHEENGECVEDALVCEAGFHEENGQCVEDELVCEAGYHEENGSCVLDQVVEMPDWFTGWALLQEPAGNKSLNDYVFTENGFSITLTPDERTGIQIYNYVLEPGFSYEVSLNYSSSVPGRLLFVQLQGHGGYAFTAPAIVMSDSVQQFTETLVFSPEANYTENGWLTIELLPGGETSTITITDIEVTKTALPTCAENEELDGLTCIPKNNGFTPNGTPTAWFDGWEILTIPAGNKEIEDLDFTETGYTVYLGDGDRSGIQLLNYVFESGYTYELRFDYTASVAGRMVWVQMEALGGYGFTNTETWTIDGTATFSQTLEIPSTYNPVEPGWIKLEFAPGAQDNITIDNIQIIKTPIN